jgi:cysteine desulfurase/selenocysteine lyase
MRRLGVVATARASVYLYNVRAEIEALAQGLEDTRRFLAGVA